MITSDGGVMVWRELERKFGIIEEVAGCFDDYRDSSQTEFDLEQLLSQRIFGLLAGYEDLVDHDDLRGNLAFGAAIERDDPTGQDRRCGEDKLKPGAGKSTLNRLELGAEEVSPEGLYKKIVPDLGELRERLTQMAVELIEQLDGEPERVVMDLDPSDVLLHGDQEGKYYHGLYGDYCYLPLYAFVDRWPLEVLLCRSSEKPAREAQQTIHKLVETLQEAWEDCTIVLRGDADFSRVPELMEWVEAEEGVEFVFGLKRNSRLERRVADATEEAREAFEETGQAARRYTSFRYKTSTGSWSRRRRVVAKAEYLPGGDQHEPKENTRFVVTSIDADQISDQVIYDEEYSPRGDAENGIFETQQQLFGNRASTAYESSNQLRMLWSAIAELFVTTQDLSAKEHATVQCACQEGVDSAISKTCNFPNSATAEDMDEVYRYIYDHGGKGVTVYRDGTRSKQVLTTRADNAEYAGMDEEEAAAAILENIDQAFGDIERFLDHEAVEERFGDAIDLLSGDGEAVEAAEVAGDAIEYAEKQPRPDVLRGVTQRIETGYGKVYITINEDAETGRPFELFANTGMSGGFTASFTEALAKSISVALRSGVDPGEIADKLRGIRSPKVAWDKGEQINSIPDAFGVALRRYLDDEIDRPYPRQQNLTEVGGDESDGPETGSSADRGPETAPETDGGGVAAEAPAAAEAGADATQSLIDAGESPECPDCGSMSLYFSEGCKTCQACGWSEC